MPHPKGGYKIDGKRVPSVTTILGRFKESGGLLWWAFEQGKAAERGEINSLYDKRDEAADAGTLAHDLVEQHIKGQKAELPEGVSEKIAEAALRAYQGYLQWARITKLQIVETEIGMVSERHRFGGTPDAIGRIDVGQGPELCLLDWKTSKSVYPDMLCQLAAYKELWEENFPERRLTAGCHLLKFSKSDSGDFAHHFYPDLSEAWNQFVLLRAAYDIDKVLKRRAA
jgi:hypothetical protein